MEKDISSEKLYNICANYIYILIPDLEFCVPCNGVTSAVWIVDGLKSEIILNYLCTNQNQSQNIAPWHLRLLCSIDTICNIKHLFKLDASFQ